ncbi:MAG: type I-E CRISPR-associated protein Cse1/CasA [Chloroflexota bacterium]|nr:MAG: type I-E CRISPR-associated protein Cse1/CasA [Chloroflexota bacterium]
MTQPFNLIDKPWLPCVWKETGKHEPLSLRQVLLEAHHLSELYGDTPLTTAALHRLLLAIVYAIPWQKSWKEMWNKGQGQFPEEAINSYFAEWQDHFDLFNPERPFYQMTAKQFKEVKRKLEAKSKKKVDDNGTDPVSRMAEEKASGNNTTLFDHTMDNLTLSAAEAARRLVSIQAFGLGGGKSGLPGESNYTAGPGTTGILFLIEGHNLFETLILNFVDEDTISRDIPTVGENLPIWAVKEPPRLNLLTPNGYLDYLTWQSRRIRLIPKEIEGELWVERMYFFPGRENPKSVRDPLTAFEDTKKDRKPIGLNLHRALWRNSAALLTTTMEGKERLCPASLDWIAGRVITGVVEPEYLFHYMAFGLKTNRGGSIEIQRHERMPLPLKVLAEEILQEKIKGAIQAAEDVGSALGSVELSLAINLGLVQKSDKERTLKARAQLKLSARYWSRLEMPFYQFMRDLSDDAQNALDIWRQTLLTTVHAAFAESTSKLMGATNTLSPIAEAENLLDRKLWFTEKEWQPKN